jgi:hypothetical protein
MELNLIDAPWHGTRSGYTNHGCNCDACSEANSKYLTDYRAGSLITGRRNKTKIDRRNYRDRREDLWRAQHGLCAMCHKPLALEDAFLDHDHKCCYKKVPASSCGNCDRGAVHMKCNTLLGFADDDVELLLLAVEYLSETSTPLRLAAQVCS